MEKCYGDRIMALTLINGEHHRNPSGFNNKIRWILTQTNYDFNNFEKVYNSVKRNEHWERAFNNARIRLIGIDDNIDNWNVRIIQNGDFVEDQLYNIYDCFSFMIFDEGEGFFKKEDYEKAAKQEAEHRSSIYPFRSYHIKDHDYYSVSVSLSVYLKMIKGEMLFPFSCNLNERRKYNLFLTYGGLIPESIKKLLNYRNLAK